MKNKTIKSLTTLLWILVLVINTRAQTGSSWIPRSQQVGPLARYAHAMAFDSFRGKVVLFGGANVTYNSLNDTWLWDGSTWTQVTPATAPPMRCGHAMAYDSAHRQIVMFGGVGTGTTVYLNDTWVWDGSTWTQKFPQNSPSGRSTHAMAYDSAHNQVILFGGSNGASALNDVWVWDGSNWIQKFPQANPQKRSSHAMTYDSTHGRVVLFGGLDYSTGKVLSDTWVWDGANWMQVFPQVSPPGRYSSAMTYDSFHQQAILFGGWQVGVRYLGDTWVWDGSNWTQKSMQSSPLARQMHAMAYDAAHGQVVLFAGFHEGYLSDTWTWDGAGIAGPTIDHVISASSFGGLTTLAPCSWIEIYGQNLATSSRSWTNKDFTGNKAPISIDGVQVTVGGQKAFLSYISPGQINAQLPSIGTGPQSVTVTNDNGTSMPADVTVRATQPGLLAPPSFKIAATQYVVAQLSDGTYVLPTGALFGVNSRPAKPGETIVIYGIGFGSVIPDMPAGQVVTQADVLSSSLQISFAQMTASVLYAGLAPGLVGLYQFNIVVPEVPDSNLVPLTFNLGGVLGAQTLYTAVHQ